MSTNLVNYLQKQLNQGNVTASNNVTNWSGTCYVTPLIGAFVADSYFGRYWTIAIFSIIYVFVSFWLKSNILIFYKGHKHGIGWVFSLSSLWMLMNQFYCKICCASCHTFFIAYALYFQSLWIFFAEISQFTAYSILFAGITC